MGNMDNVLRVSELIAELGQRRHLVYCYKPIYFYESLTEKVSVLHNDDDRNCYF